MADLFWTSYAVMAGAALGLGGTALGLLVARDRFARAAAPDNPTHLKLPRFARR